MCYYSGLFYSVDQHFKLLYLFINDFSINISNTSKKVHTYDGWDPFLNHLCHCIENIIWATDISHTVNDIDF